MAESIPIVPKTPTTPIPTCDLAELLQDVPLHSPRSVRLLFSQPQFGNLSLPQAIRVHCDHEKCEGVRRHFVGKDAQFERDDSLFYYHLVYACSNCISRAYFFTLKVVRQGKKAYSGVCTKIYQEPTFGLPIPSRLFKIIGEENREHFLQARRSIARGLGIGAYSYYRRIIENTKFDLVSSVLAVAQATNAPASQIELLKRADAERQFSKAMEILRDVGALPPVLLIEGQNPLLLLHDLLSDGIHQLSDEECLERSKEAEVVLCEMADRMQIAMSEKRTVKDAVTSIMKRKAVRDQKAAGT